MKKSLSNFAFLDGNNIHIALKDLGWILDWRKLRIYLKEKYAVERACIFLGYVPEYQNLYRFLTSCGFEIVFKKIIKKGRLIKANVDMEIAVQVMKDYKHFDRLVLITNDGDFAALVDYLKAQSKLAAVISPHIYQCAIRLRQAAEEHLQCINQLQKVLQQKKNELHSVGTEPYSFAARIFTPSIDHHSQEGKSDDLNKEDELYSIRTKPECTTTRGDRNVAHASLSGKYFDSISSALDDLRHGKMVIVVDSEKRENEGDLVMAAEFCRPEDVNFMISHAKGLVCVPMDLNRAMKLSLPLMVRKNEEKTHCKFTVSCDVKKGISTGISASDRAKTIQALADDLAVEQDFVSPGHVFPIIADPDGLKGRQGHTEATLELLKRAGLKSVGVICEIIREDGEMMRGEDLLAFKKRHGLSFITIEQLLKP